jgi:putative phosphoribosyl transferase
LHALKNKKPRELICAIPVAPPGTLKKIHDKADRIICLSSPIDFYAAGQFYLDFSQVTDEEVIATLADSTYPMHSLKQSSCTILISMNHYLMN